MNFAIIGEIPEVETVAVSGSIHILPVLRRRSPGCAQGGIPDSAVAKRAFEIPIHRPPPVVVVLTHIDVLRPGREWTPPYNIVSPDSTKAQSIRGALQAVSTLHLPPELLVPVCLLPERLYNVEEALVPLLVQVLPEAKRTLFLRSLKTLRRQEEWELLGRQARATGRWLLQLSGEVLQKSLEGVLRKGSL